MLQLRAAGRRGGDSIRSSWAAALRKSPHPHHPHHRAFLHTSPSRNVLGWFSRRKDPKTDNSDVTPEKPSEPKQLDGEEEEASITHQGDDPADTYTPSTYPPLEEGWSIPDSQDTAYQSTAVHHLDLTDAALPFPYGISDFPTIREQNKVYVDQTQFIPVLERLGPASMYLRPDHWGKTTLATTLRAYYDRNISETAWKQLFRGLHATGRPDIHHMVAADPDLGPIFGSMTEAELNEYLQRPRHVDPEVETEGMSLKQGSTLTPEQKEVLDYSTEKKHRPAIHALAQQTSISPQSISDSAIKEWLGYKQRLRDGMDAWIHARAHNPTATQGEYVPYLPPEASAMSRTAAVPEGQLSVTPDARQYAVLTLNLGTQLEIPAGERGLNPGVIKAAQAVLLARLEAQGDEAAAQEVLKEIREGQAADPITLEELQEQYFLPINEACVEFQQAYGFGLRVVESGPEVVGEEESEGAEEVSAPPANSSPWEDAEPTIPGREVIELHPNDALATLDSLLEAVKATWQTSEPLPLYVLVDDFDSIAWHTAALFGSTQPELFREAVRITQGVFDWIDRSAEELLGTAAEQSTREDAPSNVAFPFRSLSLGQSELIAPEHWKGSRNLQERVEMLGFHRQHLSQCLDLLEDNGKMNPQLREEVQHLIDTQFAGYEFLPSRRRDCLQLFQPKQLWYALSKFWQFGSHFVDEQILNSVSAGRRRKLFDELHDPESYPSPVLLDWLVSHRRFESFVMEALTCRVPAPTLVQSVQDLDFFTKTWKKQPMHLVLTLANAFGFSTYQNLSVPYLAIPNHFMQHYYYTMLSYLTAPLQLEVNDFLTSGHQAHLQEALDRLTTLLIARLQRSNSLFERMRTHFYIPSLGARVWFLLNSSPSIRGMYTPMGEISDFDGSASETGSGNFDVVNDIVNLDSQVYTRPNSGAQRAEFIFWPDRTGQVVRSVSEEGGIPVLRQEGDLLGPILVFQTLQLPIQMVRVPGTSSPAQAVKHMRTKPISLSLMDHASLDKDLMKRFTVEPSAENLGKLLIAHRPGIDNWAAEARQNCSPFVVWSLGPEPAIVEPL